jgi:hypothetical protein
MHALLTTPFSDVWHEKPYPLAIIHHGALPVLPSYLLQQRFSGPRPISADQMLVI